MRKKQADTMRSEVNAEVSQDKMDLEIAKYVTDTELSRAELIGKTLSERNKMERDNADKGRSSGVEK